MTIKVTGSGYKISHNNDLIKQLLNIVTRGLPLGGPLGDTLGDSQGPSHLTAAYKRKKILSRVTRKLKDGSEQASSRTTR